MEKLEKENQIRQYFNFYQRKVLPEVRKLATQKKDGYHGLNTHTDSVVFRAIDYALELGQNPMPVIFAAACHDMARTDDNYNEEHGPRAVPLAQKVMAKFPDKLTEEEKFSVCYAIKNHTEGTQTNDYVAACLWDADRTRLAWERGYHECFFQTPYAKKMARGDPMEYITRQNEILKRPNENRENVQSPDMQLKQLMEKLKSHTKQ